MASRDGGQATAAQVASAVLGTVDDNAVRDAAGLLAAKLHGLDATQTAHMLAIADQPNAGKWVHVGLAIIDATADPRALDAWLELVGGDAAHPLLLDPWSLTLFWVGCGLTVGALVVFVVMSKMGLNGPRPGD